MKQVFSYHTDQVCPACGLSHRRIMDGKCLVCWSFNPEWQVYARQFHDAVSDVNMRAVYDDMFDKLHSRIVAAYRERFTYWSRDVVMKNADSLFKSSLDLCGDISFLDGGDISIKWTVAKNHYPRQMRPINPILFKKYDMIFGTWMTSSDSCIFLQYSPRELSETCMASIQWTSCDYSETLITNVVVPEQEFRETWEAAGFKFEWAGYSMDDDKCLDLLVPPACENTKMLFKLAHGVYPLSV